MRVDCYLIENFHKEQEQFVCRLAQTALQRGYTVHIHLPAQADVERLDARLWDFRPDSFVPHARCTDNDTDAPVTLGTGDERPAAGLLIDLTAQIPSRIDDFERIAVVLPAEDAAQRVAAWRARDCEVQQHTIEHKAAMDKLASG